LNPSTIFHQLHDLNLYGPQFPVLENGHSLLNLSTVLLELHSVLGPGHAPALGVFGITVVQFFGIAGGLVHIFQVCILLFPTHFQPLLPALPAQVFL
jgi:hypothetical protein